MNERIKELHDKAFDGIDILEPNWFLKHNKKFAELIIRECANQCTHDGPFCAEVVWGKQFREKILEHFGVE